MKVNKVINNNIISTLDENGEEIIVMGRGIGFGIKSDAIIDQSKIEKIFRMDSKDETKRLKEVLYDAPIEHVRIVSELIQEANRRIHDKIQRSIYITLLDHINFAIERQKRNIQFNNPLLRDIKRFYPVEYALGIEAINVVKEKLGIILPEDEAAAIALHFINAQLGQSMSLTMDIPTIIEDSIKIIKAYYNMVLDEETLNYERFLIHMKFFAERTISNSYLQEDDMVLNAVIKKQYKKAYECAEKIGTYVNTEYQVEITFEELTFLAVHIVRITKE
ncbi:PRD domain-containing protein [Lachnospiraceae bacterium OttesenSCG-928-D06]|nr:PRD domain-containing protein [Lachnospiraceae bacterium OttesenSCG-928-D06]